MLRNTSLPGQISFVDWTPAPAFPDGDVHAGFHAVAFRADPDGAVDIFLGGTNHDFLFRNVPSNEFTEMELGGEFPPFFNADPIAVAGDVDGVDQFAVSGVLPGGLVSLVLNGCGDLSLDVVLVGGEIVFSSERGGLGVEEALQFIAPGESFFVRLTLNQACGDADGDGDIDVRDFEEFLGCFTGPGVPIDDPCRPFDFDRDADADYADFAAMQVKFTGAGQLAAADYILEALGRD